MNKAPLISVITVVFNGEKYLQQTIDSVKNQTYTNIEYIVVDGVSTDGTIDIIKKNSNVISKWISEPDNGLYDAMNKGIQMAKGELIGMINSDDWYELDAVKIVTDEYLKFPNKVLFHGNINHIRTNNSIKLKKHNPSKFLFKYYGMMYNHPSMFIHKDVYKNYNYNSNLKSLSDYQFTLEIFYNYSNRLHYIDKVISNFRLGGISAQINLKESLKEGYIARKNAGMRIIENIFSIFLRLNIFVFKKVF